MKPEIHMNPSQRGHVNKHHSARAFRRDSTRTKNINMAQAPMRGGWRL